MKRTITLCSSAQFFRKAIEVGRELEELGFKVILPQTAVMMKRSGNFDVASYKTWFKDKKDYQKKTKLIKDHFKKVEKTEAILVLNEEKEGLPGYIGGNTLMEMGLAFFLQKPIFIYNRIDSRLKFKEEVYGLNPIFINRNLKVIAEKLG
ncbi:MAG TPA: hypothetical protein VMX77_02735 [Candidatus Bathyarchaeia archaeon]|nr:hypothetical protein [Candidatus Bathyarchaeia archaeon]